MPIKGSNEETFHTCRRQRI